MYRPFLVILLFLLAAATLQAQANRFSAYASAGFVASQVEGDTYGGFDKGGLAAGVGLQLGLPGHKSLWLELQYVQKGSRKLQNPDINDYSYYKLNINYAEVPVLLAFHLSKLRLFAGPVVGFYLSSKEERDGGVAAPYPFRKNDYSLAAGAGLQLNQKWSFNVRFTESLVSIRKTDIPSNGVFGRFNGQYNTAIIFLLNFHFR